MIRILKYIFPFVLPGAIFLSLGFTNSQEHVLDEFIVQDSLTNYTIYEVLDKTQQTRYYYSDIEMYPCFQDKCELMNLRIFWSAGGYYMFYRLDRNHSLTKLNHKEFNKQDYIKLHHILLDSTSDFRFLEMKDLTMNQAENSFYDTDAVSGATIDFRDFKCVNGAVKTTFTLWHVANGTISEQLQKRNPTKLGSLREPIMPDSQKTDEEKKLIAVDFSQYSKADFESTLKQANSFEAIMAYNYLIQGELKYRKQKKDFKKDYLYNFLKEH